jgi:4-alpha-glucanotransferase
MVTTHDLPTLAGMTRGVDRPAAMWDRLDALVPDADERAFADVAEAVYARLGAGPSALAAATLEDLLGVVERPNVPGTLDDERPNWSMALPEPLESLAGNARALRTLRALAEGRGR